MVDATSTAGERYLVTGLFAHEANAERAYRWCVDRGYEVGEINVVISEATRQRLVAEGHPIGTEMASRKAEGGELGGPKGGNTAVLVAALAAVGTALALPGLGIVAAGPIAAALLAAGAAGLTGGLIGALGDWGLPEDRVRRFEGAIHDGGILIGVDARSADEARRIAAEWKALGAADVHP